MKCKHSKNLCDCSLCISKVLKYASRKSCENCYANAFIAVPDSGSIVLRTFANDELISNPCTAIPLTNTCDGTTLLQLTKCKSPSDKWCKIVDQGNGFITSLQVPKGCHGCYAFDLSASVALLGNISIIFNADPTNFQIGINIPGTFTLRLSEQLHREICVADEVTHENEKCFTSVLFPIPDTPMISQTRGTFSEFLIIPQIISTLVTSGIEIDPIFESLSVSGTVCLKDCQRLVPSLTIQIPDEVFLLQRLAGTSVAVDVTNIKLLLANLSLKLIRIGDCAEDCTCKKD